ncbi:uncharacterized protein G2W53_031785 [Senna tora]|uniref:Uncharacterized protein n=1 Tax=Senna tora TaxID=362788 RepID=A0A834T6L8_9FABA|nr:uncharacterized protein G2W53_031785 [Senna tora]
MRKTFKFNIATQPSNNRARHGDKRTKRRRKMIQA